ncbi:MAG: alpha/beta hydrolase family protein [Saprospiraceae bacterium]|nr:alpha/beta hydrolase family protein [Saprospiraceae bacterium]MBK7736466.1 alpha/beta hydrolase family protein [Saprospiraceae bacterium]MBK7912169.1 alpha/beta hydrolase family protein [Saprospiraceae bacterium]
MNKFFSQLIDNLYQKVTNKKSCSLLFEKEEFDGKEYSNDSFHEFSKQYFNWPENFYRKSELPDYLFDIKEINETAKCKSFSFTSPFSTKFQENTNCYYKIFSEGSASTLLIFSPGWARPNLKMEQNFCTKVSKAGIDCILPIKPFHQERTPDGYYSGELFISANQLFTVANFRQYVSELRQIVSYYRSKYEKLGIVGMSSGGFQAGLLATVEELDFYLPFITGAELGGITWNGSLTRFVKKDLLKKNVTEKQLNDIWAIADQKYLGNNCKAKYIKQYISKYDEVVPTKYQLILNDIYKKPPIFYINSAHTSVFFSLNSILADMIKEIKSLT